MPIYEYKCPKCGSVIDKLQSVDAVNKPKCEVDGEVMEKQFSIPAFKFANGAGTDMGNTMAIPGQKRTQI